MALYDSDLIIFKKTLSLIEALCGNRGAVQKILTPYRILEVHAPSWPAAEQKVLSEEIAELALAALLDGGEKLLKMAEARALKAKTHENAALLKQKLELLMRSRYLDYLKKLPKGFGFVTYPGYLLIESAELVKRFPGNAEDYFEWAYPVIYELEGVSQNGKPLPGWLAFFFVKPQTMRDKKDFLKTKTLEAVISLEKLNAGIVGLGGLSASYTGGGQELLGKVKTALTTGHNYTVANILNTMTQACNVRNISLKNSVVTVVGAAGSVGSGLAASCAEMGIKELVLIDPRPLNEFAAELQKAHSCSVSVGLASRDIPRSDVILVATSALDAFMESKDLKQGAIIIDDSQPKSVGSGGRSERPGFLTLEGGAVSLPPGPDYRIQKAFGPKLKNFNWNTINNPMAMRNEVPCCFAESMIWALTGENRGQFSIGRSDAALAKELNEKAGKLGFGPGLLQAFGKAYSLSRHQGAKVL